MALTDADYLNQLQALLPKGPAWEDDDPELLNAWSQEFARIQARIDNLIDEADPRTTFELLLDYERIFGLPTDCMTGVEQNLQQRRNALVTQMITIGGQSRAYFIALAAMAGFAITITEFDPFTVASTVNEYIYGMDWWFAWQINAPQQSVNYFLMTSAVNEALAMWGNNLLECLINRYKPAHTIAIFAYS